MEIACDESGYEGERLAGGTTGVFAHASVRLAPEVAADCVRVLRDRIKSPATEYKANHVLRGRHRKVLLWLLGPDGPALGRTRVYLVEKAYALVTAVAAELLPDAPAGTAALLYRQTPQRVGAERWRAFLYAANAALRLHRPDEPEPRYAELTERVRELAGAVPPGPLRDSLSELTGAAHPDALRARQRWDPAVLPPLDPLMPAIVRAAARWGAGGAPVEIVHDRQRTLSEPRIAVLGQRIAALPDPVRFTGLRLVPSYADPRVQVADFLAGVARKVAEEELYGNGDPELIGLLRPYLDQEPVWGDARSWTSLGPRAEAATDT